MCTIETQNLLSRYLFDRWRYLPNSFVEIVPGAITLRKVGVEKSGEKADNVECELETFGFYFWTLLILSATWAGVNDPFATLVLQRVKVPRSWVRTGDAKTNGCWVDEYFRWSL